MHDGRRRYPDLPRSVRRIRGDVDDEIAHDLDLRVRELVAGGIDAADARAQAAREFGDIPATRAYCAAIDDAVERRGRWSRWAEDLRVDLALALRSIRAMPAFAAVVLLTLAVGIGANAAIYSVVRRMLIDALPYRAPNELVRLYAGVPPTGGSEFLTAPELRDLATLPSLRGVAAFGQVGGTMYAGADGPEPVPMASVTPNFFAVLGAAPALGRAFGPADAAPGAPPVALISDALWRRVFHGDSSVVGRTIPIVGGVRTIIGIMPHDFVSPGFTADLWNVMDLNAFLANPARIGYRGFRGIARLAPGATIARATSDAATVAARWRADGSIRPTTPAPRMDSLRDAMVGDVRPALLSVMAAALLLLVITCTNVAGLFLARATSRRREMAVRIALGAGRGRLIRQLLTESACYGAVGGALGVALAVIVKPPLVRVADAALPKLGEIRIDPALTITAVAVSLGCSIVFGVMPALAATRVDIASAIGDAGRGTSASGARARLRHLLVASQIALAVLLAVGAGLLLRSFGALVSTDLGYSSEKSVVSFMMDAPVNAFATPDARRAFFADALGRIRAVPGVASAGITAIGPWNGPNAVGLADASPGAPVAEPARVDEVYASDGYLEAIGTRVLRGRGIVPADRAGAAPVAVLSDAAAHRLFGNQPAIGRRIILVDGPQRGAPREVVGVVEDYRPRPTSDPSPAVYVSDWELDLSTRAQFVVRTTGDPGAVVPALRRIVRDVSPSSSLIYLRSMNEILHGFIGAQQLMLTLFALFAALALALAALGVYAVMSYVVATRAREFGIRAALGARRRWLVGLVFRQGLVSAAAGIAAGLALAFAGARLIAGLLFAVTPHDPMTFVLVPALLLATVVAACAIPAWRATRADPVQALRGE